jgi:hypothetical protein
MQIPFRQELLGIAVVFDLIASSDADRYPTAITLTMATVFSRTFRSSAGSPVGVFRDAVQVARVADVGVALGSSQMALTSAGRRASTMHQCVGSSKARHRLSTNGRRWSGDSVNREERS